jgi:hypothetical protein
MFTSKSASSRYYALRWACWPSVLRYYLAKGDWRVFGVKCSEYLSDSVLPVPPLTQVGAKIIVLLPAVAVPLLVFATALFQGFLNKSFTVLFTIRTAKRTLDFIQAKLTHKVCFHPSDA